MIPPDRLDGPSGLVLDLNLRRAHVNGTPVPLKRREVELLEVLLRERGRVVSFEELSRRAWDQDLGGDAHFIYTTAWRLRRSLSNAGAPDVIESIRGVGYLIDAADRTTDNATIPYESAGLERQTLSASVASALRGPDRVRVLDRLIALLEVGDVSLSTVSSSGFDELFEPEDPGDAGDRGADLELVPEPGERDVGGRFLVLMSDLTEPGGDLEGVSVLVEALSAVAVAAL